MIPTAAAALVLVGAVWLATSSQGKAKAATQLRVAADAGTPQPGQLQGRTIRTGLTPAAWKPYCPPGAHKGPHRMYGHPVQASPNFTRLTTAPDAYGWLYCPPSEVDL